jgi:hypothetical protein
MTDKVEYQIIHKAIDEAGIHLIVKDKMTNNLFLEGHPLTSKDLSNKALLRERPSYFMPIEQQEVDEILMTND